MTPWTTHWEFIGLSYMTHDEFGWQLNWQASVLGARFSWCICKDLK